MKVSEHMNQLIEDDAVSPDTTASQPVPKKRGRPRKTAIQSTEVVSPSAPLEPAPPKTVDPRP